METNHLRKQLLTIAKSTNSSHCHIGSCLSCIDVLAQLFLVEMKSEDKFILSKGHAALALFVILNQKGILSNKDLQTYLQNGTYLGIHTPGSMPEHIPLATGSLGHGLSFACGMAYGYLLIRQEKRRVFCLISDGECNEGAIWEAAQFASRFHLKNLTVLIDKNNYQAFGKTRHVLGDGATAAKWQAFGFAVTMCDGHSKPTLHSAFKKSFAKSRKENKPAVIICRTKRGKGIPSLENKLISNYTTIEEKHVGELYFS